MTKNYVGKVLWISSDIDGYVYLPGYYLIIKQCMYSIAKLHFIVHKISGTDGMNDVFSRHIESNPNYFKIL